jgi:hypothetical protein
MRSWSINLAIVWGLGLGAESALSQAPVASINFRNDLNAPVIIQGTSITGGMIRRGQPVLVAPGKSGGEFNVPAGVRFYTVYDANQPTRVLARDVRFEIPAGANLVISVRVHPNNQVVLVPEVRKP